MVFWPQSRNQLFTSITQWFDFDDTDSWALFHSYAFDLSVWEFWGALLHGGRIVVVPYWISRSPGALYNLLADEKVTQLCQTPTAFRQLQVYEDTMAKREWDRSGTIDVRRIVGVVVELLLLVCSGLQRQKTGSDPPKRRDGMTFSDQVDR